MIERGSASDMTHDMKDYGNGDMYTGIEKIFEDGREIGFEDGREIGFENGREIGFENGREVGKSEQENWQKDTMIGIIAQLDSKISIWIEHRCSTPLLQFRLEVVASACCCQVLRLQSMLSFTLADFGMTLEILNVAAVTIHAPVFHQLYLLCWYGRFFGIVGI